jgi:hypothetical protein
VKRARAIILGNLCLSAEQLGIINNQLTRTWNNAMERKKELRSGM